MWKFLAVLIVTILCVHAEEEQPKNGKIWTQKLQTWKIKCFFDNFMQSYVPLFVMNMLHICGFESQVKIIINYMEVTLKALREMSWSRGVARK